MHVRSLYLQGFRNYKEAYFEFDPCLNFICGPNAQGKTSLLEALHYLMVGRSFRTNQPRDLINWESSAFHLETIFCKYEINQKLSIYFDGKERKIFHNCHPLSYVSHLFGLIQGVVMTPDHVQLVKGSPLLRRQFLDIQMTQIDPLYVYHLMRYTKAMRHRNQLLKQKTNWTIESWEHEMASSAAYLVMQRRHKMEALQLSGERFYGALTEEKETFHLNYCSKAVDCQTEKEIKEFYLQQYEKNRTKEMALGMTFVGPHKDDLSIRIGDHEARSFASEGQQRSCIAALYLAEWQHLKQKAENPPLLMIDDLGVSLDNKRRERFLDQLISLGQVFLTTTDCLLTHALKKASYRQIDLPLLDTTRLCCIIQPLSQ
jgi:DNA replication and repair protein RecF